MKKASRTASGTPGSRRKAGPGIRVIITGGTFDKHYDEIKGVLTFRDTHLPEILTVVRCTVPIALELNQLIDSLEMRDSNRRRILHSCQASPEAKIIVTHGTDTMAETAGVLGRALEEGGGPAAGEPAAAKSQRKAAPGSLGGKTIVLTGAMIPYAFQGSDALFNLGTAVAAVQLLPAGVFVVMNGRIFPWNQVKKNRRKGVFETAP